MNDSTRRAIRTSFDLIPAIGAAILILVPVLGLDPLLVAKIGAVVGAIMLAVSKVRNALEDAGIVPSYLKNASAPASDVDASGAGE